MAVDVNGTNDGIFGDKGETSGPDEGNGDGGRVSGRVGEGERAHLGAIS